MKKSIPHINTYKFREIEHCCYKYPQFKEANEDEIRKTLINTIENPDPYFLKAYSNHKELISKYKIAINIVSFRELCEYLYQIEHSWIRYNFFIDLKDRVVIYEQCCS